MTTSGPKPIDPRQHVWWHRLRRLGPLGFVGGLGGVLSPAVTCLLFGSVVWFYHYPFSTFVEYSIVIWLLSMPLFVGACAWTWVHMEKRYRATLAERCPHCGYSRRGVAVSARCPECGAVATDHDRRG